MARSGAWVLLVSLAAPAAAQDAGSFSEMARLVEVGDDVRVTLSGGRSISAQVAGVTPDTLSVIDGGIRRDLGEADVWGVDRRLEDSNANGAWVGFAVGAAFSMGLTLVAWEGAPSDAGELVGLAAIGGLHGAAGAWVGYGIDRLIRREERVYHSSGPRLSVAPVLSTDHRGVAVSLSF